MKKRIVDFGNVVTISSSDFGDQPTKICLKYDRNFIKSGIYYISVLSPLAQAIYKKSEGEEIEYLNNGKKLRVKIIKVDSL